MHLIKRLFLPTLLMLIIFTGGTPTSAQQIGTTTLVSVGIAGSNSGYSSQITPDGRHVVFVVPILYTTLAYVYDRQENTTHLVSVSSTGVVANWYIYDVTISDDGNIVAFASHATNLIPNDTNGVIDIYVHNRQTGQTSRVSVDSAGNQANNETLQVELSSDGRYVSFSSKASNLVANDTNGVDDIFVHDRQTGQTTRVSVDSAGNQANGNSTHSDISADGRYVTFTSTASNLVANDTNGVEDVFVHDRQTGQTTRVSVDSAGNQGNAISRLSTISGDGRYIAFLSDANNLVANDTNLVVDAFVHDLQTATTTRVSVSATGGQLIEGAYTSFGSNHDQAPFISSNGQYVAYTSRSSGVISGDFNNWSDVFVHNRQTGENFLASRTSTGAIMPLNYGPFFNGISVSDNGQFVTFSTDENTVVPNDRNRYDMDVFVYDRVANSSSSLTIGNPNILPGNTDEASSSAKISGDGRYTVFISSATNLIPNKTWTGCDIYVHDHQTQSITIASVTDTGQPKSLDIPSIGCQTIIDISDDGRYVAFRTPLPFVVGDTNNVQDIYLRDMVLNTTIRIPTQSHNFDLSGNGRYISFSSTLTNLVPNDTNGLADVFVYDIQTQTNIRVSVDSAGNQATGGASGGNRISADGRFVLFTSAATNLVPNDTNGVADLFLHDTQTGETVVVSVDSAGNLGNNAASLGNMSDDGRYIVFPSLATNLVPNDTNGQRDVFFHDRQTGQTSRVSVSSFGVQGNAHSDTAQVSNDGTRISFVSGSTTFASGDTNNQGGIFVHNRVNGQTTQITHFGISSISEQAFSDNGDVFVFSSSENNIVPGDLNNLSDVFRRELLPAPIEYPDAPNLIAPADMETLVSDPPTLTWGAVVGATQYHVQIATDSNFYDLIVSQTQTETSYFADTLFAGTYYWRVSAINAVGNRTWSVIRQFTQPFVAPLLQAPTLIAPVDMLTLDYITVPLEFTWDAMSGVPEYEIQISTDNTFSGTPTSYIVTTNSHNEEVIYLPNTYYWRVRTVVRGLYGEWSVIRQFELQDYPPPLQAPTLTAPVDMFTTDYPSIDFTWEAVAGVTAYQIQISPNTSFQILYGGTITTNSYTTFLPTTGNYYWRVRTFAGGIYGEWSSVRQFTLTPFPAPVLISPQSGDTGYSYQTLFDWEDVEFANYYDVQIATNPDMTGANTYTVYSVDNYSHPLIDGTYYWRVRARRNTQNTGAWSEIRQFVKQASAIPAPTPLTPVNNATFPYSNIGFTFTPVVGAFNTEIQIATDANFETIVWTRSSTPYSFSLAMNQTYYWRVRSLVISQQSIPSSTVVGGVWSETNQFTITPFAPVNLLLPADDLAQIDRNITFTWEDVATGGSSANYRIQLSRDEDFSTILYDQLRSNSLRLSWNRTLEHGTFYWRVRAEYASYNIGNWSEVRQLTFINLNLNRGITSRVSVASDNQQGNFSSTGTDISTDGRYVVFTSGATNLVPNDTNNRADVFVHDRQTMQTTRVSIDSLGNESNQISGSGSISDDGRYVVFTSTATNLVPNDTNAKEDVFVHDRQTGQTRRISVSSTGVQANQDAINPKISGNGRYVVFASTATTLVPTDTNSRQDVFLHDLQTGQTRLVSVNNSGGQANGTSSSPSISDDGRLVAFTSLATNLSPNDLGTLGDVYIYDFQTSQITLASVSSDGTKGNATSGAPMISGNGRYLVFASLSSNLDGASVSYAIYLRDLQTNQTTRVSVNSEGVAAANNSSNGSVSNDGRYVVFASSATNLMPDGVYATNDIYRHDTLTGETIRISVSTDGIPAYENPSFNQISGDGSVAIFSAEDALVPSDTNDVRDVFVIQFKVASPSLLLPADETFTVIPVINFSWSESVSATGYRLQIATDSDFANMVYDVNQATTTYSQTLTPDTYYWRVLATNEMGDGAWSNVYEVTIGISQNISVDEQQLFNMAQSRLTHDMTFALFDITPTGIITTVQFSDGGVVTGTITMPITNGLVTIMVDGVSGGSAEQQIAFYDVMPAFIMAMFDEALPDEYESIETLVLTDMSIIAILELANNP